QKSGSLIQAELELQKFFAFECACVERSFSSDLRLQGGQAGPWLHKTRLLLVFGRCLCARESAAILSKQRRTRSHDLSSNRHCSLIELRCIFLLFLTPEFDLFCASRIIPSRLHRDSVCLAVTVRF